MRTAPFGLISAALLLPVPGLAQVPPPALSQAEAADARRIVEGMKVDDRGPYAAIRWYCADGSVHPPQGTPCLERGGGVQHGEMNLGARRLEGLHIHVGTVLAGVDTDSLIDTAHGHHWLKELVLTSYLFEVDDGWVLRRARYYRGARQIEDEELRGEALLVRLLSEPEWTRRNFLLASRLVATLPHGGLGGEGGTGRVRNLATEIADLDPEFLPIRIKIHSLPSSHDLSAVEAFQARRLPSGSVAAKLDSLRAELARLYDPALGREALVRYGRLAEMDADPALVGLLEALDQGRGREALGRMAELSARLRRTVESTGEGRRNLSRMDLLARLQTQAFLLAQVLGSEDRGPESRLSRIRWLLRYFDLAYAAGFLSGREREALEAEALRLSGAVEIEAMAYQDGIRYLARSLEWSWGRVRSVFGPVHQRYLAFEPAAHGFLDAEVRGGILLRLADELTYLSADADRALGASHRILGEDVHAGVRALNPGLAMGPLDFLDGPGGSVDASHIYVLPLTLPELRPVAGLLNLEEGNLLSHVQLLARNLGIPNASLSPALEALLRSARGEELVFAVSPMGRVVLERPRLLREVGGAFLVSPDTAPPERILLDTRRLRLDRIDPLPLGELRAGASGVWVGPKAANLGQLASYFPGHVAPGVALPFGMFVRHADRPFESDLTLLEELRAAYRQADRMREEGRSEAEIDARMFRALEKVRRGILELEWEPELREVIVAAIGKTFGSELARGVFIRSDTNVEDLPQFSGAGLNLTVPHRRTLEEILQAVKQVWTSPFSERAYLWRKQILREQGEVYPSVLLLASVPSEKSGVLITSGLEMGGPSSITVVTAEGVGGGVEGEEAETLVVGPDGSVRLLAQAKAPRRRALADQGLGGVEWRVAATPDTLLRPSELSQLLEAARRWRTRFAPGDPDTVWDMEFGFVDGRLWLFQVRPFVQARGQAMLERLGNLDREVLEGASRLISLLDPV